MKRLADRVHMLELTMNFMGNHSVIHPVLLQDGEKTFLVDAGMPGQLGQIEAELSQANASLSDLNHVILTHQDIDHIGSLPELLKAVNHPVEVLAHELDKPYIEGEKPPFKLSPERVAKMLESLPDDQRAQVQAMFAEFPKAKVDTTLSDGQFLPYCGGITVVFTPGHTPGHISLYLHESKTLVTGDAMVVNAGQLLGPSPQATPDMETATDSLKRFTAYDVQTVVCYHGGVFQDNANERLAELAGGK